MQEKQSRHIKAAREREKKYGIDSEKSISDQ